MQVIILKNYRFYDRYVKCRRYPLTVFIMHNAETMKFVRHLPEVTPDEYCGEFVPKPARAPTTISVEHL